MKSFMDIIALMYKYNMRKNTGTYTFSFVDGNYEFWYNSHSTGRSIYIFILSPDGDKMRIYDRTEWYSSTFYFNGFGNGFVNGPWVKEVQQLFAGFISEMAVKVNKDRKNKRANRVLKKEEEKKRFAKFSALCTVQ